MESDEPGGGESAGGVAEEGSAVHDGLHRTGGRCMLHDHRGNRGGAIGSMMPGVNHGVQVLGFIGAVKRSAGKELHEAVLAVFRRTGDWRGMLGAASAVEDKAAVKRRMGEFLNTIPAHDPLNDQMR